MKKCFLLLALLPVISMSYDPDKLPQKCGSYEVAGFLDCPFLNKCNLLLGKEKQTKYLIALDTEGKSISFAKDDYVIMNINMMKLSNTKADAKLESFPIRQASVLKREYFKINKEAKCIE